MKSLSIVCFITNINKRGHRRVYNFLYSLRNQVNNSITPEIIVVNVSNDDSFEIVDSYCKKFNAIHVYSKLEGEVWNKSVAINSGIKMASGEYVMSADIDNLYQPNFLEVVEKRASEDKMLLCLVHLSKKNHDLDNYSIDQYRSLRKTSPLYKDLIASGACQLTTKKWFESVKGYHEDIKMWGGMDNEMHWLAEIKKLKIDWLNGSTSIVHQWHIDNKDPRNPSKEYQKVGAKFRNNNKKICRQLRSSRKVSKYRNKQSWGELKIDRINNYQGENE